MRPLSTLLVSALVLAFTSAGVAAQGSKKLYRWTDEKGEVHYTDQLPPEAAKSARDELNKQGMTVQSVGRARTPEEQAAYEAEQAKLAEQQRLTEEQAKMDSVLLGSYATEADLKRAYDDRFDMVKRSLEAAQIGIQSQDKSLAELLAHAAGLERDGKPVPENIVTTIVKTRQQVTQQRDILTKREAEQVELQQEFEATLARYRELTAKAAAQASGAQPPSGG